MRTPPFDTRSLQLLRLCPGRLPGRDDVDPGGCRRQPDIAALSSTTARIVVGIGDDSAGQLCDRSSRALASALGIEPTLFPGGHTGFVEDPDTFAIRLREALREG
ncbi:hypothetical protein [Streptomyces sp. 8N616]|uniref:hypothetical protein n=1 Tax=Streptomyces sp. 8N616 TaxID=3457414 RepID=UPI003FD24341